MSDAKATDGSPTQLFFVGSDDEDEQMVPVLVEEGSSHESEPIPPSDDPQTPARSPLSSALFLTASHEDEAEEKLLASPPKPPQKTIVTVEDDDIAVEVAPATIPILPEYTQGASTSDHFGEPPTKKRRLSPVPQAQSSRFTPTYLGDILVENAWSTASGKGYAKSGDSILVHRDQSSTSGIQTKKTGKKSGGKKQGSITSMLKPQTTKPTKKKVDSVVRLKNLRGFEFARLPTEVASWISRLLDFDLVEIRGTMTDCPEKLSVGIGLMVTLHVYILPEAFTPLRASNQEEDSNFSFNEGFETQEERLVNLGFCYLRERKASILKLFDAIGLRPRAGAGTKPKKFNQKYEDAIENLAKRKGGKTKKELVGDGEEIEVDATEELSGNDLNLIYQKAQQKDNTMSMMEPAESFNLKLRGYQKQALSWMQSIEHDEDGSHRTASMHPLWSQLEPNFDSGNIDLTADEKEFYFNPYSGELSLDVPKVERRCRGGILADVGMGKTIMVSALIQTSRLGREEMQEELQRPQTKSRQLRIDKAFRSSKGQSKNRPPSATLIVAPTSLLGQWAEEIGRSSKPGTLQVVIWHGQNRLDLEALVEDGDEVDSRPKVVVTSYGTLASEHAKSYRSSVFEIYWLRIVLDEAHACKSRTSKTAKAIYDLRARWRWAVTGTPIVNKLEDLFSLLKFLNHKPWSEYAYFRSFITLPFLARDPKAIEIVQVILESVLLRREKNMLDVDGKRIVELPPKKIMIESLEFSSLERKIYDSIWQKVKKNFDQLEAKGLVSKNYTHILAMLMRLRRAVLHPNLVLENEDLGKPGFSKSRTLDVDDLVKQFNSDSGDNNSPNAAFAEGVLANLADEETTECPICFDVMQIPTIIPECAHQCCKDCILTHIATCEEKGQQPNCFACGRGPIKANELLEVVRRGPTNSQPSAGVVLRTNSFQSSTKLEALLRHLRRLKEEDPAFRAVVFSQFTSFMDLIQTVLQREKYDYYRFDGTMDVKKRSSTISAFKAPSQQPKILVISLKAGGVGLNLTTANHVFMMDCWWNAATENQAIDRVHRIGQEKTVHVTHFIVTNTIEGRILQIQKRKTAIVHEAFRGGGMNGRADPQSIENLKIMFGEDD
ncbi:DNA repair protein RAD5 [Leucoagaricus sp. SymC.cos]|nr:DNA repair protein RAD5 [Leucoagaricus sp. SymC.cos]